MNIVEHRSCQNGRKLIVARALTTSGAALP
jgi:hypothetical protein